MNNREIPCDLQRNRSLPLSMECQGHPIASARRSSSSMSRDRKSYIRRNPDPWAVQPRPRVRDMAAEGAAMPNAECPCQICGARSVKERGMGDGMTDEAHCMWQCENE